MSAMEMKSMRWLAVVYKCPQCGSQTGHPRLTPTKRNRERSMTCTNWRCKSTCEIVERRYYTTFAIESGVSVTMVAGTLEKIGPFDVCQIVKPNIRAFRKWVEMRRAELAEQHRVYMEEWKRREVEGEARRKKELTDRTLLKEVERVAYQREHAIELQAEQVMRAVWPHDMPNPLSTTFREDTTVDWQFDDEHPF